MNMGVSGIARKGVAEVVAVSDGVKENCGLRVSMLALTTPEHPAIKTDITNNDITNKDLFFIIMAAQILCMLGKQKHFNQLSS
jgi:hypothetical protein